MCGTLEALGLEEPRLAKLTMAELAYYQQPETGTTDNTTPAGSPKPAR